MIKILHPVAGTLALALIASFWLSSVISEVFASQEVVTAVKAAIPWAFFVLVPALMATGGSGFRLMGGARVGLAATKLKRMPIVAANGVLVLIPCALYLATKARAGEFDQAFYAVQALELVAGGINIALLGLNMRDGFRLTGRFRRRPVTPAP